MIVGCYTTDLYCDFPENTYEHRGSGEFPGPGFAQFTGQSFAITKRRAIECGWHFASDGKRVLCPSCIKQGRKLPRTATP